MKQGIKEIEGIEVVDHIKFLGETVGGKWKTGFQKEVRQLGKRGDEKGSKNIQIY